MTTLTERLRAVAAKLIRHRSKGLSIVPINPDGGDAYDVIIEAADLIDQLTRALEPFARAADAVDAQHEKQGDAGDGADLDFVTDLKCGDLRRARQALSTTGVDV